MDVALSNGLSQIGDSRSYRAFGFNLTSSFLFQHHLTGGKGKTDLSLTLSTSSSMSVSWKDDFPLYQSPWQLGNGESASRLYRLDSCEVFRFPQIADFYLQHNRVAVEPFGPKGADLVELRFLGPVLSYWMEQQGIPTLHASAVAINGKAVSFLSRHGGGKTGLAAALMQAGHPLLSDDILPVEEKAGKFYARPGYPQMRMWPDEAAHFLGRWEELPTVLPGLAKRRVRVGTDGFGAFHDTSLPLAGLYLAERRPDGPVEIIDISPRDALIELIRHSFAPQLVEAAGLQPYRFDLFARLVRAVPVRRLVYPSGFDRLPEVVRSLHNLDANSIGRATRGRAASCASLEGEE